MCPIDRPVVVKIKEFDLDMECDREYISFDGETKCGSTIPVFNTTNTYVKILFVGAMPKSSFNISLYCLGMLCFL